MHYADKTMSVTLKRPCLKTEILSFGIIVSQTTWEFFIHQFGSNLFVGRQAIKIHIFTFARIIFPEVTF